MALEPSALYAQPAQGYSGLSAVNCAQYIDPSLCRAQGACNWRRASAKQTSGDVPGSCVARGGQRNVQLQRPAALEWLRQEAKSRGITSPEQALPIVTRLTSVGGGAAQRTPVSPRFTEEFTRLFGGAASAAPPAALSPLPAAGAASPLVSAVPRPVATYASSSSAGPASLAGSAVYVPSRAGALSPASPIVPASAAAAGSYGYHGWGDDDMGGEDLSPYYAASASSRSSSHWPRYADYLDEYAGSRRRPQQQHLPPLFPYGYADACAEGAACTQEDFEGGKFCSTGTGANKKSLGCWGNGQGKYEWWGGGY